jgi:hypothetical protein
MTHVSVLEMPDRAYATFQRKKTNPTSALQKFGMLLVFDNAQKQVFLAALPNNINPNALSAYLRPRS